MYILIEGIDTCGKSTQIELLKAKFDDAIFTKEPGGTEFGVMARELLLHSDIKSQKAELLLFLADRAEHFDEIIKPNLDKLIISDRGFISGIAYALSHGFDIDYLIDLNKFALDNTLPQKVILFEITKQELQNRVSSKSQDKIEQRGLEYLLQIQQNLIEVTKKLNIDHIIIDATDSIESIHTQIVEFIIS
jgi:dTMP kinase